MVTNEHIQNLVLDLISTNSDITSHQDIENELCGIVKSGKFNLLPFHNVFTKIIYQRLEKQIDLWEINNWKLFNCLFRYYNIANAGIELRCTEMRRLILLESINSLANISRLQELILSIAIQCDKNEYAYYIQADEIQSLETIASHLEKLIFNNGSVDDISILLLLVLMYRSPLDISYLHHLKTGNIQLEYADLNEFIEYTLYSNSKELEMARHYMAGSNINDEVSIKVAKMYEDNPYPRWTESLVSMNPHNIPLELFTGVATFPKYRATEPSVNSILVAGCGTGRHPIQLALNYPWTKILAIDISYRSIGYAAMMAEKAGINNIEFRVCDILDLIHWDEQFDMIDCVGVLHHMSDPDKGLKALLTRLRCNGLLRLGLYSKSARKAIIRFREKYLINQSELDQETIRKIRREVIQAGHDYNEKILQFDDFYSTSGCRDLILHVQETQYTIPQIKTLLDRHHLTFLGIGLPHKKLIPTIRQVCGPDADIHDLDNWHKAELNSPFLFSGMYNFFAQKQD
jgi:SAM-dependent methyltransferase